MSRELDDILDSFASQTLPAPSRGATQDWSALRKQHNALDDMMTAMTTALEGHMMGRTQEMPKRTESVAPPRERERLSEGRATAPAPAASSSRAPARAAEKPAPTAPPPPKPEPEAQMPPLEPRPRDAHAIGLERESTARKILLHLFVHAAKLSLENNLNVTAVKRKHVRAAELANERMAAQVDSLEGRLEHVHETETLLESTRDSLFQECRDLEEDIAALRKRREIAMKTLTEQETKLEGQSLRVRVAQEQVASLNNDIVRLQGEKTETHENLLVKRELLEKALADLRKSTEERISKADTENGFVRGQLERVSGELAKVLAERERLEAARQDLERRRRQMEQTATTARIQAAQYIRATDLAAQPTVPAS